MRAWVTPSMSLYLSERRLSTADSQAPDRPSDDYEWQDGTGWIVPADISDRKAALEVDNLANRLLFEIVFSHENRLRALEGKPTITRAQCRALLITLLKSIS